MSTRTAAVIQARMGSTRLPGKVMLPLGGRVVLEHVVERVRGADEVDEVVVATSTAKGDDIVEWCADRLGVTRFRGSEEDVLDRTFRAAASLGTDEVVRITADCPLVHPPVIDEVVARRRHSGADYAANVLDRTFPRGLDVEAFSWASFERVYAEARAPAEREHVTLYYRTHPDEFELVNVTADTVFDEPSLQNRTDLRLTLDELDDYRLLRAVFDGLEYEVTPPLPAAVHYIDAKRLAAVNAAVEQKDVDDEDSDSG